MVPVSESRRAIQEMREGWFFGGGSVMGILFSAALVACNVPLWGLFILAALMLVATVARLVTSLWRIQKMERPRV